MVVRLLVAAAVGGALVAGLSLPAVGALGTVVRNAATKFNTLGTPELHQLPVRSAILDRHGKVLAYYYPRGIDRVPVTYAQIAPAMRQAIVAIEDSRFYQHGAIDFRGTVRALVNNLQHKSVQGGSTLAQQYVKNVEILSSPNPQEAFASATAQNVGRKIRELRMAVQVEHTMSKDQILAGYLNAAFFGNQSYGIEVAAQRYFSTPAAKLTLPQAAMLAGIVENPSLYNPLGTARKSSRPGPGGTPCSRGWPSCTTSRRAAAAAAEKTKLALNPSLPQTGCTSKSAKYAGVHVRLRGRGHQARHGLQAGLEQAQRHRRADDHHHARPQGPEGGQPRGQLHDAAAAESGVNPGKNADTEVLIQPGTGKVRAIAIDRPYGTGKHHNIVNYAVGPQYNGSDGRADRVDRQGLRHGDRAGAGRPVRVHQDRGRSRPTSAATPTARARPSATDAQRAGRLAVTTTRASRAGHYSLYTGTTDSINVFFAYLEQKVGLCNVGQDRRPDGPDLAGREVAAEAATAAGAPPAERGQRPVVHARRRQRRPDGRRRRRRDPARPRHLLQPHRDHQDRHDERPASCRWSRPTATGCCPRRSPTRPTTSCRAT